jgi:hypothetical protein
MFRTAAGGRNQTQDILQEETERTEKMHEAEVSPPPRPPFPPVRIPGFKIVANMNDQNFEQRSALRESDFSFDFPPLRGGLRSLSVGADCLATKFRALSELLS